MVLQFLGQFEFPFDFELADDDLSRCGNDHSFQSSTDREFFVIDSRAICILQDSMFKMIGNCGIKCRHVFFIMLMEIIREFAQKSLCKAKFTSVFFSLSDSFLFLLPFGSERT